MLLQDLLPRHLAARRAQVDQALQSLLASVLAWVLSSFSLLQVRPGSAAVTAPVLCSPHRKVLQRSPAPPRRSPVAPGTHRTATPHTHPPAMP